MGKTEFAEESARWIILNGPGYFRDFFVKNQIFFLVYIKICRIFAMNKIKILSRQIPGKLKNQEKWLLKN